MTQHVILCQAMGEQSDYWFAIFTMFIIFYSIARGGARETRVGLPTKPTLRESHGLAWRNSVGLSPNSDNCKVRQLIETGPGLYKQIVVCSSCFH